MTNKTYGSFFFITKIPINDKEKIEIEIFGSVLTCRIVEIENEDLFQGKDVWNYLQTTKYWAHDELQAKHWGIIRDSNFPIDETKLISSFKTFNTK